MTQELYKKHRPITLSDLVGQDSAVKTLTTFIAKNRIPHSMLFTGPSGCGKTTIARILARKLKCSKHDIQEIDSAQFRGIDTVREIKKNINLAPMQGDCRVWIIDEVHKWTNDAQNGMLKTLEDTPNHVYLFLCTTEPNKLIKAIHTRCTEISVKAVGEDDITTLLKTIAKKERKKINSKVIAKIANCCEESPRKALVILDQVINMTDTKSMLAVIEPPSIKTDSYKICQLLIKEGTKWGDMRKVLSSCDLKEAEGLRRAILGYAKSCMLRGGNVTDRAFIVIDTFRDNFYDSGAAGLVACCYEVITTE